MPMTRISVQILSLLFGIGSWIAITGLWLEIPVLIHHLPERWSLASDVNLVIQLANIGPIVYFVLKRFQLADETNASHILLVIGSLSCILLITSWDLTIDMFGKNRSMLLFVATFGLALLDCTSSVTFLPFMGRFDAKYLTPYLIGEGLSGFIPTIFATIQGVDVSDECHNESLNNTNDTNNDLESSLRFSAEVFFGSLLLTLLISWSAMILLQTLPVCKQEAREHWRNQRKKQQDREIEMNHNFLDCEDSGSMITANCNSQVKTAEKGNYFYNLVLIFICCTSTLGFMPSIQPYSALPYSSSTLHNVVLLTALSFPFGCFLAMLFKRRPSRMTINLIIIVGHSFAAYILVCALMSPTPPLISSETQRRIGSIVMIISWIAFTTSLSYIKTIVTLSVSEYNGDKGLFWVGFHTQLGAFLGATLLYGLINYTSLFNERQC